jgi:methylmalonyl-CoA mutase C-terminal domain/subunit
MEVIYTGLRQTPAQIAQAALQEDVDVVGLSSLSGAHRTLFPAVVAALRAAGAAEILVIGGGVIPAEDIPGLRAAGVAAVFGPGTPTADIVAFLSREVGAKR